MKILMLNHNLAGVGTYHRAVGLGSGLVHLGHEVDLATLSPGLKFRSTERITYGVRVVECGSFLNYGAPGWRFAPASIFQRLRMVMARGYDIVMGFEYFHDISLPARLAKARGVPFVSDWCDWYGGGSNRLRDNRLYQRIDRWLEERIRFRADAVTVISTTLQERALDIGIPATAVHLLPEGSMYAQLRLVQKHDARANLGIPDNDRVVGHIYDHGTFGALDAFRRVLQVEPDARLILLGRTDPETKNHAMKAGVPLDRVTEVGRVHDEAFSRWMAAPDLFILPLADTLVNRARWPHKVADFLSFGKPVVVGAVGDVADFVTHHGVGKAVGGNASDLGQEVASLLRNETWIRETGTIARRVAQQELSWPRIAERFANQVLERFAPRAGVDGSKGP